MSKNTELPVFGKPIFTISENPLEDRVQIAGERGFLNTLTYFAVDATFVKKLEFDEKYPGDLNRVIINRGMVSENSEEKSVEFRMNLAKEDRDPSATTIFTNEEEANIVCAKLNENAKKQVKKLLDLTTVAYNEYDKVIAICKGK
jgi:hypothetical protein